MDYVEDIFFFSPSKSDYSSTGSSSSSPPSSPLSVDQVNAPSSPLSGDEVNEQDDGKSPSSSSSVAQETQKTPEPLPYIFPHDDEDQELIAFFLAKKVFGRRVRFNILIERNPFEVDPDKLQLGWSNSSRIRVRGNEGYYFFTITEPTQSNQTQANRYTPSGFWSQNGEEEEIHGKKEFYTIGFMKEWEFYWEKESNGQMWQHTYWKKAPNGSSDEWIMHEYRVNPNYFESFLPERTKDALLPKAQTYRLCRIQRLYVRVRGERDCRINLTDKDTSNYNSHFLGNLL